MNRHGMFVLLLVTGLVLADTAIAGQQEAAPRGAPAPAQTAPVPADKQGGASPAEGAQEPPPATPAGDGGDRTDAAEAGAGRDGEQPLIAVPGGSALGMSILGNQEAPTSLVIVPWKTSELGASIGVSPMLDDSRQPVDRDVFMRALRYYEIRVSDTTR